MTSRGQDAVDAAFMRVALEEAIQGAPSPNPHVGAVVVDPARGEIVGRGYHPERGRDHAEVAAIREAGARARGATLYVTLEPCNHHGRTPPCTDAIVTAGIARVVVGVRDPNPHVEGGGDARLRAAGLEVVEGVEADACARVIVPFAKHVRTGRPWVRLKLASSLDGRIAAAPRPGEALGISRWITGAASRAQVHRLRTRVDAVGVGIGTALADDPALTPRDVEPVVGRPAPARVVFDSDARLPPELQLVRTARSVPTLVVVADDADAERRARLAGHGVRVLPVVRAARGVDLGAALDALGREGIVDLLIEGGARLAGELVAADLVDELHWFVAPIALGERGAAALVGLAPEAPDAAPRFELDRVEPSGGDVAIVMLRRGLDAWLGPRS